jgi:GAF domain-containing protein/pyridoxamine 5'-phosphate oxidase-like protein
VSPASVPLEAIRNCLQGAIPSPLATCAADGTPNVTYLSIVQYVDGERVATSRQFLNKTRANLDANPYSQAIVVDADSGAQYTIDLRYLHTESDGEVFETMRANLEAIASQSGMDHVFRLRGVDIHRVVRCTPFGSIATRAEEAGAFASPERDLMDPLDRFVRRVGRCTTYEETTRVALEALDDLFGFDHTILLATDATTGRLFAIASHGYRQSAVGAEVESGKGLIGTAAARGRLVREGNLARSRAMAAAVATVAGEQASEIPLPGLPTAGSACAVPLALGDDVLGVLYLESEAAGAFGGAFERVLRIVGGHLAAALGARGGEEHAPLHASGASRDDATATIAVESSLDVPARAPLAVAYYQADDSVLVGGEYLVKGVPGRILFRMLRAHGDLGRVDFTNRELRLDETLGLPAGNDNLEARLLVLRRRLAERDCGIALERVGRGRLRLTVAGPVALEEVPTSGPMRAAHGRR